MNSLIALAYTCAGLRGQFIKSKGQQKYVSRLKELKRHDSKAQQDLGGFVRTFCGLQP